MLFTIKVRLNTASNTGTDTPFCHTDPFLIELLVQVFEANNLFGPYVGKECQKWALVLPNTKPSALLALPKRFTTITCPTTVMSAARLSDALPIQRINGRPFSVSITPLLMIRGCIVVVA
jgi:hypothetical protein